MSAVFALLVQLIMILASFVLLFVLLRKPVVAGDDVCRRTMGDFSFFRWATLVFFLVTVLFSCAYYKWGQFFSMAELSRRYRYHANVKMSLEHAGGSALLIKHYKSYLRYHQHDARAWYYLSVLYAQTRQCSMATTSIKRAALYGAIYRSYIRSIKHAAYCQGY